CNLTTLAPVTLYVKGRSMEVLEAEPASWRARLWRRLSDLDKPPRSWWFPPSSRRDYVLRMPEEARQAYRAVVEQAHEKFSETVRLAMLSLLSSHLVVNGINLKTVQYLLGHKDIRMTLRYAHLSREHLQAAVGTLALGLQV